jgi:GT2 family glycosyltransferase
MIASMVSVLVPCYGDLHLLEKSVSRLLASAGVELEVVLLNNDSGQAEGVRRLVVSWDDARIRLVELEHASGFAKALNAGIAASDGELVFFANSDLFVTQDYLREVKRFFDAHPRAACATGKILRYDLEADHETSVLDTTGLVMGRDRGASDRGQNEGDSGGLYEQEEQVFGCSGAALVARREALESVRLRGQCLDESFFMYKEDVDLSWRLRLGGWECWYVPSAVAYHARTSVAPGGRGFLSGVQTFHRNEAAKPRHVRVHSMKNQWLMLVKNEDGANLVRHLPFVLGREALVLGYNTLTAPSVTVTAVREFTRALPGARESRRAIRATRKVSPAEIRRWFVRRSQSTSVIRGARHERVPVDAG